jgi:11-cis-retinol dehydrogenase
MYSIISLTIVLYISYRLYQYFFPTPNINPHDKYVLISGCDTGVGHRLAIELDKQGFNVLAGVFVQDNITVLKDKLSPRATVFQLDITNEEDICTTFELVQKKTNSLHALINNAGIFTLGGIDWTSLELMHKIMDVNFFGHVAMTKKFLPLLITKRDSRVVNMCSTTGFLAFPNTSAYSASKFALESFSDCLRREMAPWGLQISIIEPGTLRTSMSEGIEENLRKLWDELSSDVQERWGVEFLDYQITQIHNNLFTTYADDPYKAVGAIQHAVMNTNPHIRYHPGWQAKLFFTLYWFPVCWIDTLLAKALNFAPAGVRNQSPN